MSRGTTRARRIGQLLAAAVVARRLARGRRRRPPLAPPPAASPAPVAASTAAVAATARVSVVVPARDEERRIGPLLQALRDGEHDLKELIVVDDGSTDATAAIARELGARVVAAGAPPPGWVGKPWALQRGLQAARGEIVVSLDADTRPRPGLIAALVAALADADLVSVGPLFETGTAGERWLHPAMLATLVYRFGPPDATPAADPARLVVNGQCTALRRAALLQAGGYRPAAAHFADDIAQARALARRGWRVAFHNGAALLTVDMHDSMIETWREWGRTIALRDVTAPVALAADVAVVWLTLGLPPLRVLAGRADRVDLMLLGLRAAMTVALAPSYEGRGAMYWLSPLADPVAAVRLTISAVRPARRWRGRVYGAQLADDHREREVHR